MSSVFYPLGLIEDSQITMIDRTIADEFEDGTTATRQLWTSKYFKRRISVKHCPLTPGEFEYLRSFFAARSGRYDSFWYRDNVHRTGNISVRLAEPFPLVRQRAVYKPELMLEEIAPVRALVDAGEIFAAATGWPIVFYDPNRQIFYQHMYPGQLYANVYDTVLHDSSLNGNHLAWAIDPATKIPFVQSTQLTQYQKFNRAASGNAAYGSITPPGSGVPVLVFAILTTTTGDGWIFAVGSASAGAARGLQIKTGNVVPNLGQGSSESYTNAKIAVSGTLKSYAVIFQDGAAALYVNGVLIGSDAVTLNDVGSSGALFGDFAGNNSPNTTTAGPVMALSGASFDVDDVKALHNLFATQYGLTAV